MIVKSVGTNGQITLGKEFAGRLIMIDQTEPGVWTMRLGQFIPDNEKWLHAPEVKASLDRALEWDANNSPGKTDFDALEARAKRKVKAGSPVKKKVPA